jgi:hypothetical protein
MNAVAPRRVAIATGACGASPALGWSWCWPWGRSRRRPMTEPFVPFGRIAEGMNVESAMGGRAGQQDSLFTRGNGYLKEHCPLLDYITTARVER